MYGEAKAGVSDALAFCKKRFLPCLPGPGENEYGPAYLRGVVSL
jgi:hypothetical protein